MDFAYLYYQLKMAGVEVLCYPRSAEKRVEMFLLYAEENNCADNILYVLDGKKQNAVNITDVPVLIQGDETTATGRNTIVIRRIEWIRLINILNRIFTSYHQMMAGLMRKDPDLKELMNLISKTLGTPATIISSSMVGIAYSDDLNSMDFVTDASMAAAIQRDILWDRKFYASQEYQGAFLFENNLLTEQTIYMVCYNINVKQQFFARFALLLADSWKVQCLKSVTEQIGSMLEQYFNMAEVRNKLTQKTAEFHNAMQAVVSGTPLEDSLDLNRFGWYEDQEYQVYVFRLDSRFPVKVARDYLQKKLGEFLGECFITEKQAELICVTNRSISGMSAGQSREQLVAFLSEYLGKAGISNPFNNLFEVPKYVRQAQWAMKLGEKSNPMHWYHYFRDYSYDYALEQSVREFSTEEIIMPELFVLRERDREKGSALFDTLEAYIRNKCNGQATARELFIHRTTFLYRMEQIRELIRLDVQQEDVYKKLLFSFELYRRKKSEPSGSSLE